MTEYTAMCTRKMYCSESMTQKDITPVKVCYYDLIYVRTAYSYTINIIKTVSEIMLHCRKDFIACEWAEGLFILPLKHCREIAKLNSRYSEHIYVVYVSWYRIPFILNCSHADEYCWISSRDDMKSRGSLLKTGLMQYLKFMIWSWHNYGEAI